MLIFVFTVFSVFVLPLGHGICFIVALFLLCVFWAYDVVIGCDWMYNK